MTRGSVSTRGPFKQTTDLRPFFHQSREQLFPPEPDRLAKPVLGD
ncbi:hypothetical protein RBSWK_05518 [Rhodopirellula baltica SWK14]|uniref:Uncharacterized protein n=1 Tax=Rhodopirellula baltica SWK14 TaxID=993516 RepID=L7CBU8_RHOBT|nr:hypothetical protein RBSWK_05518 [Rhodopirellula baltica SWK14]